MVLDLRLTKKDWLSWWQPFFCS